MRPALKRTLCAFGLLGLLASSALASSVAEQSLRQTVDPATAPDSLHLIWSLQFGLFVELSMGFRGALTTNPDLYEIGLEFAWWLEPVPEGPTN